MRRDEKEYLINSLIEEHKKSTISKATAILIIVLFAVAAAFTFKALFDAILQ